MILYSFWYKKAQKKAGRTFCSVSFSLLDATHAAGYTEAGCNGCQHSQYRLNDEFPSVFFHMSVFEFISSWVGCLILTRISQISQIFKSRRNGRNSRNFIRRSNDSWLIEQHFRASVIGLDCSWLWASSYQPHSNPLTRSFELISLIQESGNSM